MAADNIPSLLQGKTEASSSFGDKLYDLKQLGSKRTSFNETGAYRVENLSYPIDLLSSNTDTTGKYPKSGSSIYGNNYVVFYININASSKLLTDTNSFYGNKTVPDWSESDKTRIVGQEYSAANSVAPALVGGGVAGAVVSGAVKTAAIGAGAAGVGIGAIMSQTAAGDLPIKDGITSPKFTRQMKRLTTAIALNTPNTFNVRYGMNWDTEDTSTFQMAAKGSQTLAKAASEYKNGNSSGATDTTKQLSGELAALALSGTPGKAAISAITGMAVNPKKEQMFKSVDFRTFNFEYQFFPKSKQEYQNVQNIIYLFKLHMHPEYKDTNGFVYLYPSEFDIVHYNGVDENFNLPRHTSCALTELNINYSPQSQFTSFEGGIPTQINIALSFKELSQLSKERIQEGF